jgi:hypothetical protein
MRRLCGPLGPNQKGEGQSARPELVAADEGLLHVRHYTQDSTSVLALPPAPLTSLRVLGYRLY